mmetsp:Transcript_21490/g.52243  ORF Transcript_21490/g.52243 Transcript_21490/m.52243 type:complete len:252 (-) Transcript_21490:808-1563(-)
MSVLVSSMTVCNFSMSPFNLPFWSFKSSISPFFVSSSALLSVCSLVQKASFEASISPSLSIWVSTFSICSITTPMAPPSWTAVAIRASVKLRLARATLCKLAATAARVCASTAASARCRVTSCSWTKDLPPPPPPCLSLLAATAPNVSNASSLLSTEIALEIAAASSAWSFFRRSNCFDFSAHCSVRSARKLSSSAFFWAVLVMVCMSELMESEFVPSTESRSEMPSSRMPLVFFFRARKSPWASTAFFSA